MMTSGLLLVWFWGHRPGPPLPVLGELPAFHLVAQNGEAVTNESLAGEPGQTVCDEGCVVMAGAVLIVTIAAEDVCVPHAPVMTTS